MLLDAYAQQKRADGVDCVSVQWGQWAVYHGHESSDIENLARLGYLSMRSADAIPLGLGSHAGNVAIAAFDWDRAKETRLWPDLALPLLRLAGWCAFQSPAVTSGPRSTV